MFARKLATAQRVNVTNGLGNEITDYEQAETMLLQRALVVPLGVQKAGYLVSPHVDGLNATPLGLQPSDENWTTVAPK